MAPQGCARRPLATLRERKATANAGKLETMDISRFDELLAVARGQAERQRLLLVFAGASLPDGATAEQQARFEAGESGELAPLMCVDKDPGVLADFATLVEETPPWVRNGPWCSLLHCPARVAVLPRMARSTRRCSAWSRR